MKGAVEFLVEADCFHCEGTGYRGTTVRQQCWKCSGAGRVVVRRTLAEIAEMFVVVDGKISAKDDES